MPKRRVLTQKEIKGLKEEKDGGPIVTIYNPSAQMITIRMKGKDFFMDEQSVYIHSKRTTKLPSKKLDWDQIENLQKRGFIKVVGPIPER